MRQLVLFHSIDKDSFRSPLTLSRIVKTISQLGSIFMHYCIYLHSYRIIFQQSFFTMSAISGLTVFSNILVIFYATLFTSWHLFAFDFFSFTFSFFHTLCTCIWLFWYRCHFRSNKFIMTDTFIVHIFCFYAKTFQFVNVLL